MNEIKQIARQQPLSTRLHIEFTIQWYDLHIKTNRFHTLKEEKLAHKWAKEMTKIVMKLINEKLNK